MMQAAGIPTLRKSRSVGQPLSWWCPRQANLGQPPNSFRVPIPGGAIFRSGADLAVYHPDWLGSMRLESTLGDVIIRDVAYTPYGETYANFGGTNGNLVFAGDFADLYSGLYDTPNREFDVQSGSRWLSPDPANQGWNQYAYPTNPNSFIDPLGLRDCLKLDGTVQHDCPEVPDHPDTPAGGNDVASGNPNPFECDTIGSGPCGAPGSANPANNRKNCTTFAPGCYNVPTLQEWTQHCIQLGVNQAARTAGRNWLIGEGVAAIGGGIVGGLVASTFTAATETWPFAGQTIPSGIVSGGIVGATEALPYMTAGALAEFGLDAYGVVSGCQNP